MFPIEMGKFLDELAKNGGNFEFTISCDGMKIALKYAEGGDLCTLDGEAQTLEEAWKIFESNIP